MPEIEEASSPRFLKGKGHDNPHIKGVLSKTL